MSVSGPSGPLVILDQGHLKELLAHIAISTRIYCTGSYVNESAYKPAILSVCFRSILCVSSLGLFHNLLQQP